ncbi:YheC/YheD family endospore coat-associated protein [Peribacillus glennii]|nr:YheC/YheD family protein [Peribacillus glennii]
MNVYNAKALIKIEETGMEETPSIQIEQSMISKWKMRAGEEIILNAGVKRIPLLVRPFSAEQPLIILSVHTGEYLSLPALSYPVQITYCKENKELAIGPFLSVLTDTPFGKTEEPFGSMEPFLQEMQAFCQEKGLPFYVHQLQSETETTAINGYLPIGEKWEQTVLPVPDVVYNRIHSRTKEKSAVFQRYLDRLNAMEIPMFNDAFLSKLEVHEILIENEQMLPYLPKTIPFQKEEDFANFLVSHEAVYVKPSNGSQGRNICKITKTAEGWVLEHSSNNKDTYLFSNALELFNALKKYIKKQSYIVQNAIDLLETENKKVDFRILLNKNQKQAWRITSVVARIGDAGHIVSNLSRGAEMINGLGFLHSAFDHIEAKRLFQQICMLALQSANCLSEHRNGIFGELGVDVALDIEKQPWLIEINSKPSKAYQGSYDKFRPSVKAIVGYMHALYQNKMIKRP